MQIDYEVAQILLSSCTSSEAIRRLVELRRSRVRTFSLAVLSRRSSISKSYLSEVISAKKNLNIKYVAKLAQSLQLGFLETECLKALVEVDRRPEGVEAATAEARVAKARRVLRLLSKEEDLPEKFDLLAFDLYASFGMFGQHPTADQLCHLFSDRPRSDVLRCLESLVERQAIHQRPDGTYAYTENGLVVVTGKSIRNFVPVWRQAALDAIEQMPFWADRREESCFTSYVISVKMEDYRRSLEELKSRLIQFASAVDSTEADSLVRVNVQVFPIRQKVTGRGQG